MEDGFGHNYTLGTKSKSVSKLDHLSTRIDLQLADSTVLSRGGPLPHSLCATVLGTFGRKTNANWLVTNANWRVTNANWLVTNANWLVTNAKFAFYEVKLLVTNARLSKTVL